MGEPKVPWGVHIKKKWKATNSEFSGWELNHGDCLSFHFKGSYSGPLDGAPALFTGREWVVKCNTFFFFIKWFFCYPVRSGYV